MKIKLILSVFLIILVFPFFTSAVQANEGRIILSNGNLNCEGISVWQGYDYQITGRCFGLVYPFDEQLDNYILWVKLEDGEIRRVGEVERGTFDDTVTKRFTTVYITAESEANPSQAGRIVISGDIQRFSFANQPATFETPAPTIEPVIFLSSPTPLPGLKSVSISRVLSTATITGIVVIALVIAALLVFIRRR